MLLDAMGAGASVVNGSAAGVEVFGGPFGYIIAFGLYAPNEDEPHTVAETVVASDLFATVGDAHLFQLLSLIHSWPLVTHHLPGRDVRALSIASRDSWGVVSFEIGGSSYSRAVPSVADRYLVRQVRASVNAPAN